jgi:hypothetical protein
MNAKTPEFPGFFAFAALPAARPSICTRSALKKKRRTN